MYSCKKILSVAKMAKTVYEREMCSAGLTKLHTKVEIVKFSSTQIRV